MSDLLGDVPEPERHYTICMACGRISYGGDSMAQPCSQCGEHRKRPASRAEVDAKVVEVGMEMSPGLVAVLRDMDLAIVQEINIDTLRGIQRAVLDDLVAGVLVRSGMIGRVEKLDIDERLLAGAKALAVVFLAYRDDDGDGEEEPEPVPEPEEGVPA